MKFWAENWLNDLSRLDHVLEGASPFTSHYLRSFTFPDGTTQIPSLSSPMSSCWLSSSWWLFFLLWQRTITEILSIASTDKDQRRASLTPWPTGIWSWVRWGTEMQDAAFSMITSYSRRELLEMREGACYVYILKEEHVGRRTQVWMF